MTAAAVLLVSDCFVC